jgi:hypothetical protein
MAAAAARDVTHLEPLVFLFIYYTKLLLGPFNLLKWR